jgi:hypothetical protein
MRFIPLSVMLVSAVVGAQEADGGLELMLVDVPVETESDAGVLPEKDEVLVDDPGDGFVPNDEASKQMLQFNGYIDVGFAKATGNGSSFSSDDTRVPLDYYADAFAPAVNSRGEVASIDTQGRFTNGFLPRSVGINGNPSFLLNTASFDVKFQPKSVPLLIFARAQLMPRFTGNGDGTRIELQQAFGRLIPFSAHEFALFLGRFDSVFGIEYLENEANLRVGITPSLFARYTTGHGLGAKAFYRIQIPSIWTAVSVNAAATNGGTRIEALVPVDASLTGFLNASGRLGIEMNHPVLQFKLGVSGSYGARNDQRSDAAFQKGIGADFRLYVAGISISGEALAFVNDNSLVSNKFTGVEQSELASGFNVYGAWGRLAYTLPIKNDIFTGVTLYGRYEQRRGTFTNKKAISFTESGTDTHILTDRFTAGIKIDLFEMVNVKAEWLINREVGGVVAYVNNNVFTSSAVFTW